MMGIRFNSRVFAVSLGVLSIVYLLLFFYGDVAVSEFARDGIGVSNSALLKSFNSICGNWNFMVLAFGLLVLSCFMRDKKVWRKIVFVALSLCVAMLFKDVLKTFFGRARPEEYFKDGVYGMKWFQNTDAFHSTPSGHSTRAMALAVSLAMLVKRRWLQILLILFAVAQALCRVVLLRHYLSDVLFGMWLGVFVVLYIHTLMFASEGRNG